MTKEKASFILENIDRRVCDDELSDALDMAIKALEQNSKYRKEAKRWKRKALKQESIPYLMHKEMDIPISECQKAYEVTIDYLRNQVKVKGDKAESDGDVRTTCYYNDGEVHAECVICDRAESEE